MKSPNESPETEIDLSILPDGYMPYFIGKIPTTNQRIIMGAPPHPLSKKLGRDYGPQYSSTKVYFVEEDGTANEQPVQLAGMLRDGGTINVRLQNGQIINLPAAHHDKPPTINSEPLEKIEL